MGKKERLDPRIIHEWETICLKILGQRKYNETRHLDANHKGVEIKPYIPCGKKVTDAGNT